MPFYEYECRACGAHHEAMQKMSDAPLRKCPACGRQRLVRLVSAPAFRLKGGGWYETDFKSGQESKRNLHAEEKADKADATAKADKAEAPAKAEASPKDAKPERPAEGPKPDSKAAASAATAATKGTTRRSTAKRGRKSARRR